VAGRARKEIHRVRDRRHRRDEHRDDQQDREVDEVRRVLDPPTELPNLASLEPTHPPEDGAIARAEAV
jgi:hypothetical protein